MTRESIRSIATAKKESQLFREISSLLGKLVFDEPALGGLMVTRVQLSSNKSMCTVYFFSIGGEVAFREKLGNLILYKPSMRKALSQAVHGRYTPDIKFTYDHQFEKVEHINTLLEAVSTANRDYDARTSHAEDETEHGVEDDDTDHDEDSESFDS